MGGSGSYGQDEPGYMPIGRNRDRETEGVDEQPWHSRRTRESDAGDAGEAHAPEATDTGDSGRKPKGPKRERKIQTSILRIIADDYDQAQRSRIVKGEQIRAIVQGRDETSGGTYLAGLGFKTVAPEDKPIITAADQLLKAILRDPKVTEPHPYLTNDYRLCHEKERAAYDEMSEALEGHPAWAWLRQIRGVGPTLGAKLLARLDLDRANNSSSFWAYCGLSTIPGQQWTCKTCGYTSIHSATYEVTGKHKGCKDLAVKTAGPEDGVRAAKPAMERGQEKDYDAFAKKTLYLLAMSWLKAGAKSFYNDVYRKKLAYYDRERPGWQKGRKHYGALRCAEKMFLSHLYESWCRATGREPVFPYPHEKMGHEDYVSPERVLEWERRAAGKEKVA